MEQLRELLVGRDEDIKEKITAFLLEQGWESAYISGGIGSVKDVVLTAPRDSSFPPQVVATPCPGPGELLAFTGEAMKKERMDPALKGIYKDPGPLFLHIHASVAVAGGQTLGGGFQQGKAFRAVKVYLWKTE